MFKKEEIINGEELRHRWYDLKKLSGANMYLYVNNNMLSQLYNSPETQLKSIKGKIKVDLERKMKIKQNGKIKEILLWKLFKNKYELLHHIALNYNHEIQDIFNSPFPNSTITNNSSKFFGYNSYVKTLMECKIPLIKKYCKQTYYTHEREGYKFIRNYMKLEDYKMLRVDMNDALLNIKKVQAAKYDSFENLSTYISMYDRLNYDKVKDLSPFIYNNGWVLDDEERWSKPSIYKLEYNDDISTKTFKIKVAAQKEFVRDMILKHNDIINYA